MKPSPAQSLPERLGQMTRDDVVLDRILSLLPFLDSKPGIATEVGAAPPSADVTVELPNGKRVRFAPAWKPPSTDTKLQALVRKRLSSASAPIKRPSVRQVVAAIRQTVSVGAPVAGARGMSLLIVDGMPAVLQGHRDGRFDTFSTYTADGVPRAGLCPETQSPVQLAEHHLRRALRMLIVHSVAETILPAANLAIGQDEITLVAPHDGTIRVTSALPPRRAIDRNVWWNDLYIGDTHLATMNPVCDIGKLNGRKVREDEPLGSYAPSAIEWPKVAVSKRRTHPEWQVDMSGAASRLMDLVVHKMMQRASTEASLACNRLGELDLDLFSWLLARGKGDARAKRLQALSTFPVIAALSRAGGKGALDFLTDAVDTGEELLPLLLARFDTSVAALRETLRLRPSNIGRARFSLLAEGALREAAKLQPDYLPGRGAVPWDRQWRIYLDIYGLIHAGRGCLLDMSPFTVGGPLWTRLASNQTSGIQARVAQVIDCLNAAYNDLLLANLAVIARESGMPIDVVKAEQWLGPGSAGKLLREGRGFAALEQIAKEWEQRFGTIASAALRSETFARWPALSDSFRDPRSALTITALTSAAELQEEGEVQRHCVGHVYANACLFGPVHILSIRDDTGQRCSTAEIRIINRPGNLGIEVVQHAGPGNSDPPEDAASALAEYVDGICDGSIRVEWNQLYEQLNHRLAARCEAENRGFGFDTSDRSVTDAVFDAWRFFLPAKHQRLPRADWIDAMNLRSFLPHVTAT